MRNFLSRIHQTQSNRGMFIRFAGVGVTISVIEKLSRLPNIAWMNPSQHILFLCTANYYRSRFAELYCNHLAELWGLGVRADSAGLEMAKWRDFNPGDLSEYTLETLKTLGASVAHPPRAPQQFELRMMDGGAREIALCAREHRPMVVRDFPAALERIEFWTVEDVEFEPPARALARIRESVEHCLRDYATDQ